VANALFDKARESFLRGEIIWQTDTIKVVLVDAGQYTPNLATHQYLSDVPSGARTATSAALTSKTTAAGVADAADPVFTAATGVQSEYLVIYQDTGSAATSRLIAYIDTATGLPVTPNSGDINVIFSASGIFKL